MRSYAERISDPKDTPYVDCASAGDYQNPSGFELPPTAGRATVTSVAYLQPGDPPHGYGGGCGLISAPQQLTLQVVRPTGRDAATETLVIVKRAR